MDKHHTELLSSPYSVNFMSYEPDIGNIASGFVTSLLHGSLVHLLGVRQRLTRTLTTFSAVYPYNHTMYVELLKLLLVQGQDRVIAKTLTAFSQITRTLDSDDIEYMLSGINTISIPHHRALSKCLLAKHFGSYMSDGAFDALFREILDALRQWLLDPNRILLLGSYLFDAIKANVYRAGSNEAISLSLTVLREGPKRWVDEALGVIRRTDPTEIPTDVRNEIADALIAVLADNSRRHDLTELEPALVFVHHLVADSPTELDSAVEKHMPDYYVGNYSLATLAADSVGRAIKHIQRLLKTVHARNKEQGKSGFYYGYSDEPLDTIRLILENTDAHPEQGIIDEIMNGIGETLFAPNQTYSAKVSAVRLALSLLNGPYPVDNLYHYVNTWLQKRGEILSGHRDDFMHKDNEDDLDFGLVLLRVQSGKQDTSELLSYLAAAAERGDYHIISALKSIAALVQRTDLTNMDQSSLSLICQYVIAMSHHKSVDVRLHAARLLVALHNSISQLAVLTRLSKMMDEDAFQVKAVILRSLKKLGDADQGEMVRYIRQKGAVDNHYLIRRLAVES